jgi:hypothetical protein
VNKVFVLLLALAGLAVLVPDTREQIMQLVGKIGSGGQQRTAQHALKFIASDIRQAAAETGAYPVPGTLRAWLEQRGRGGEDPWGSSYYFEMSADSFVVGSPGPDSRVRTRDDLRLAERRLVAKPGVLIIDQQPTPPPSSAKRTAISKVKEAAER